MTRPADFGMMSATDSPYDPPSQTNRQSTQDDRVARIKARAPCSVATAPDFDAATVEFLAEAA
jgi:hypothetical protein